MGGLAYTAIPVGAVNCASTTLPVLTVPDGSNSKISATSSALVRCSTPRGTTTHSPGPDLDDVVAEFDAKPTLPDEEELVFLLVPMPRKHPLDLDELDLLPIHRGDHLGPPLLVKKAELLIEIDFFPP